MKTIMQFFVVISLLYTQLSLAQWVQTSLDTLPVNSSVINDLDHFAETNGGVFHSCYSCVNWTPVNEGLNGGLGSIDIRNLALMLRISFPTIVQTTPAIEFTVDYFVQPATVQFGLKVGYHNRMIRSML